MCPVDIGNVTTTSPNKLSAGPNNITMLPCDVEPYDTRWNTSNHRRGDGPDGSQFIRMELAPSQYYVTDSAVLTNKKTSLFRSLLRLFAQLPPVELAFVILAFVLNNCHLVWFSFVLFSMPKSSAMSSSASAETDENRPKVCSR